MAKSTQGDRSETGNEARAAPGAKATVDAGSAVAAGLQDIAQAWVMGWTPPDGICVPR